MTILEKRIILRWNKQESKNLTSLWWILRTNFTPMGTGLKSLRINHLNPPYILKRQKLFHGYTKDYDQSAPGVKLFVTMCDY